MMIDKIVKITCRLGLPASLMHHNIGSLLHGVLMEQLNSESADKLHLYRYNPIKQRLYFVEKVAMWEVVCLDSLISSELVQIFGKFDSIYLKRHETAVSVSDVDIKEILLDDFVRRYMTETAPKSLIKLAILSPTSFKSEGYYDIFPDVKKMLRSIMLNFDYFSSSVKIYDYDALEYLAGQVKILDYSLHSTRFSLEGVKLPSFKGKITLKLRGNIQTLQILNLIFAFGELSGVGIKTSLGMGYVKIQGVD